MIGGDKTPFRLPCAGSADAFAGPIIKLSGGSSAPVDAYGNTTTMVDHCGATIPATKRMYQQDVCGDFICVGTDCSDCPGGVNLTTNTPEPPAISANTFVKTGTVQIASGSLGGKRVQAFKAWPGQFGFTFDVANGLDCATGLVASNTRYRTRTMVGSAYIDDTEDPPGQGGNTWSQSRTITVDKFGQRTLPVCSDSTDSPFTPTKPFIATDLVTNVNCSNDVPSVVAALADCDPGSVTTGPGGSYGNRTNPDSGFMSYEVRSTRTDTSYTWTIDKYVVVSPGIIEPHIQHITGSITLSDPYTINDVKDDCKALAALWDFTKDKEYPFRTDKHTTVGAVVIQNETGTSDLSLFPDCGWVDPDTSTYDGAIIGAPLAAGYGQPVGGNPRGVFDKDHENWERAFCDPPSIWEQAPVSRGGFTPSYLPANAPKWTDDFHATTLFPCAFISADVSGVYLQKWAEIPIRRPSINFARPYGPDKFALDELAVYFMFDKTGDVVTLQDTEFHTPLSLPFTLADIVGGASVGGFYAVTAVGTDTVTLGTKVFDVAAGWNTPSGDGAACFGRLRNPNAPGLDFIDEGSEVGGRVAITVANESPVKLTTSTVQKYLSITTPEHVDIYDATMTLLAANVAATRVDDTHFTVPTAYATITDAKWIIPTGTKYKFADTRSKGDYVYRTWTLSLTDFSVLSTSQIGSCVAFSPCGQSVVYITPNLETPPNGNRHGFPTTINNGEIVLMRVDFWMVDPFWQPPHKPVAVPVGLSEDPFVPGVDIITWTMDDGTCNENSVVPGGGGENIYHLFYPVHPFVEARCTLPTIDGDVPTAPPVDITAVADHPPQATIANAPGPLVNAINLPDPNWTIYLKEKGCVDAAGVFANDYRANGT